jgi:hypothetical protein
VSYETAYYNAGNAEHPSEPNYVWAEQGSNFNPTTPNAAGGGVSTAGGPTNTTKGVINGTTILNDNDPSAANGNIFPVSYAPNHLTGQLNAAGIQWNNYQEDYQYSSSPLVSASGIGGTHNGNTVVANPYNGSLQYNYAVKHNPMAFFADDNSHPTEQMSQLTTDLANNTVGKYNWITPDQYNDMHTALNGGFTYNGTHFTGDQAQIAQGDNFLSTVIPEIEASQAYQNNGAIIIWNDETEGADDTTVTSTEIVISPDAKGDAYASSVPTSHSSDLKTMEEILGLPEIDNPIPTSETYATGGYATVQGSNDLSDLFQPGLQVPEPSSMALLGVTGLLALKRKRRA